MNLEGRRALISGAASGIGLASAARLASDGASVVLLDARGDALDPGHLGELGGRMAAAARCDVSVEGDVESAVDLAARAMGGIDILVCAAGITRGGDTDTMPLSEWDKVIGVNLTGTFLMIKHTLPHLVASGRGAIITIGSVGSVVAAGQAGYDASKGGVLQLTRGVAVEFVDRGVRANCILPGRVQTGLSANSAALHGDPMRSGSALPTTRVQVPIRRSADPSEIASVVAFLASDDASFVTGSAVAADGGYTAI